MNWLHYLLEANLYLAVFYLGYAFFLCRETHYMLNRVYLLFTCIVSFILPVMQLGFLKPVQPQFSAVTFTPVTQKLTITAVRYMPAAQPLKWEDWVVYAYVLGAAILLAALLFKLYRLYQLTRAKTPDFDCRYKLVPINQPNTAFSFFNYLFIGNTIQGSDTIIAHELVHINQKHSADIIFIEILKIINWFNPFIYLLQRSMRAVHEFIADEKIAASGADTLAYSSFLVNNAYGLSGSSITQSIFNYNLLKKRIIMLHQKRSGSLARLKYLLAVPICGGLLCASTLAVSKTYGFINIGPHRIDKNNMTPQVAEPAGRLLVTQHGVSVITDKFSHQFPNGKIKFYTVHNLSNKGREDLEKAGIVVNLISDVKIDSGKTHLAPPPPPAPPVTVRNAKSTKSDPIVINKTSQTTTKGYKYMESGYIINGKTDMFVSIIDNKETIKFDKNKASAADIALLKNKYGYVFPAHFKMPPPPPAPPAPKVVRFPPPKVVPRVNYTSKGYKFTEDGYAINGKTDYRVIITEKDGNQKEYFKSRSSDADIKMLEDKYGYKFPTMPIYTKLPPPPPTAPEGPTGIDKRLPPPPPAPPAKTGMITPDAKTAPGKNAGVQVDSDVFKRMQLIAIIPKKGGC